MRTNIMQADGRTSVEGSTTVTKRFLDEFSGAAVRNSKWETLVNTGGMTQTVANSDLVVGMGTNANAELILQTSEIFTVPFGIVASFLMSQRIANNDFSIEAVEVDPNTGLAVPNTAVPTDFRNRVRALMNGTSATSYILEVLGDDSAAAATQTVTGQATSATRLDMFLDVRFEETFLTTLATDALTGKTGVIGRITRQAIDPNVPYKVRLRFKNGAVAPASNTNVTIGSIKIQDQVENLVELIGGAGDTNPSRSVGVTIVGTPAVTASGTVTANQAAAAVFPPVGTTQAAGTTLYRLVALGTTNANVVKGSAGRLFGGTIKNRSAAEKFVVLYNKATAPAPATDNALIVMKIALAAGEKIDLADVIGDTGMSFSSGIGIAIVGGLADTDVTAVAANDVVVHLLYA